MVEERAVNDILLYPINYDICDARVKQQEVTEEAFRILSNPLVRKALRGERRDGKFLQELSVQLAIWILFNATAYKLPKYEKESEVRALKIEDNSDTPSKVSTMNESGKRYIEYRFSPSIRENHTILDIQLGPKTSNEHENRLLSILDELDYRSIEVSRSNLSL